MDTSGLPTEIVSGRSVCRNKGLGSLCQSEGKEKYMSNLPGSQSIVDADGPFGFLSMDNGGGCLLFAIFWGSSVLLLTGKLVGII